MGILAWQHSTEKTLAVDQRDVFLKYRPCVFNKRAPPSGRTDFPVCKVFHLKFLKMKILNVLIFSIFGKMHGGRLRNAFVQEDGASSLEKSVEKIEDVQRENQIQLVLFNIDDIIDINNNEIKISLN